MSHMSHALENVFNRIRKNLLQNTPELIYRLLEGIDALKHIISVRNQRQNTIA